MGLVYLIGKDKLDCEWALMTADLRESWVCFVQLSPYSKKKMLFLQILHEDGGSIFFSLASVFKQTQKKAVVHPRVDAVWHKVRTRQVSPRSIDRRLERFSSAFAVCPQEPITMCSGKSYKTKIGAYAPDVVSLVHARILPSRPLRLFPSLCGPRGRKTIECIKGKRNVPLIYLRRSRSLYLPSKANGTQKVWNLTTQ